MKVKIETYKSKKGERIQYNKDGGAREYNIKKESPLTNKANKRCANDHNG